MPEAQINLSCGSDERLQQGLIKRILWVIASPGKLMESLAQRPRVLFGLILAAVSNEILFLVRIPLVADIIRNDALKSSDLLETWTGQTMTAEMIEQSVPSSIVLKLVTTPFSGIIAILFGTLIYFAILKIIGGQGKFKAYLSVSCYSYVITSLYILLIIPVSFVTGSLHQDVPLTSLAILAPQNLEGTFIFGALKSLEVSAVWSCAVMAIGFTAVSKLKKGYVYGAVAGIFIIKLIIAAVSEAAMGAFL